MHNCNNPDCESENIKEIILDGLDNIYTDCHNFVPDINIPTMLKVIFGAHIVKIYNAAPSVESADQLILETIAEIRQDVIIKARDMKE